MIIVTAVITVLGLLFRVFRLPELLGFYFDQGRDALVIWDLWHNHNFFLIGPTTGIEGIFLGPFYYYLIAPFYIIGKGNPVYPAYFLSLLNTAALILLFKLTKKSFGAQAGYLTLGLAAFSFVNVYDQRWLSNPNPLTFFSVLIYWFLYKLISGQAKYLPLIALLIGISIQLEAASAIFFIPSLLLTLLLFHRNVQITIRGALLALLSLFITFVPQLIFDFRHQHILFNAFSKFLVTQNSFSGNISSIYPARLQFFYEALTQRLFLRHPLITPLFLIYLAVVLLTRKNIYSLQFLKVTLLWVLTPVIFLSFYTGNQGYVWDYYFTGIYPLVFMLTGLVLAQGKYLSLIFLSSFLVLNIAALKYYLLQPLSTPRLVTLGTSLASVDWVYQQSANEEFNVDVYVPPVVPHSYNYLFLWRGVTKYAHQPSIGQVPNLYTLYEIDGLHPQYLDRWLARQNNYAAATASFTLGGVTAEKRIRYEK